MNATDLQSFLKKEIESIVGPTLSTDNLNFLTLFFAFGHYRFADHGKCRNEIADGVFSEHLKREVEMLEKQMERENHHLNFLRTIILEYANDFDVLHDRCSNSLRQLQANDYLNWSIENIATQSPQKPSEYITPIAVIKFINALANQRAYGKALNLNPRTGEWAGYSLRNNSDTCFYNACSHAHISIYAVMRQMMNGTQKVKSIFTHNEDLSDIPERSFDLVFSNPPFGKVNEPWRYKYQGSLEGYFLKHALRACNSNGRVLLIVPEGFLFRDKQNSEDFLLRRKLTDAKQIKAVIRLPESTFYPHAKVRTAVLLIDLDSPSEEVCFIDLNMPVANLSPHELDNIIHSIYKMQAGLKLKIKHVRTGDIIANRYDWQVNTYLRDSLKPETEDIRAIEEKLGRKQAELIEVQAEIKSILRAIGVTN